MKTFKIILGLILTFAMIKSCNSLVDAEPQSGIMYYVITFVMLLAPAFLFYSALKPEENLNKENLKSQNLTNAIDNLKELNEKGIITEEEYNLKSEKIQSEKLENQILNSTEYLQLKNLYDLKVLSKEEFESKVELVKSKLIEPFEKVDIHPTFEQQSFQKVTLNEDEIENIHKKDIDNSTRKINLLFISILALMFIFFIITKSYKNNSTQIETDEVAAPVEEVAPVEYYYEETEEAAPVEDSTEEINQESSHQNTNNAMANRIYVFVVISYKQDVGGSTIFLDKIVSEITEYPEYTFTDEEGYRLIDKFYAEKRFLTYYTITDRKYLSFKNYKEASIEREKFLKEERIEIDNRRQPINYTPQIHTF